MQYLGGKSRISKQISEVINNEISRWKEQDSVSDRSGNRERERESHTFVSLFCGTCSIEIILKTNGRIQKLESQNKMNRG